MSLRTPILVTSSSCARAADVAHNESTSERASIAAGANTDARPEPSARVDRPACSTTPSMRNLLVADMASAHRALQAREPLPSDIKLRDIRAVFRYSPLVQTRQNDPRCVHAPSRSSG